MPERIDWTAEAQRTYSRPSFWRWFYHTKRQLQRRFRNMVPVVVKAVLVGVVLAYVAASGVHLSNGWSVGELPTLLAQDTRMAVTCWQNPGRVVEFVQLSPGEMDTLVLFTGSNSFEVWCHGR